MDEADLAHEYQKKAEKLMKRAEMLRKGVSMGNVDRKKAPSKNDDWRSKSADTLTADRSPLLNSRESLAIKSYNV
jgi:hypothetical protein